MCYSSFEGVRIHIRKAAELRKNAHRCWLDALSVTHVSFASSHTCDYTFSPVAIHPRVICWKGAAAAFQA
jgi:hypothetical protein